MATPTPTPTGHPQRRPYPTGPLPQLSNLLDKMDIDDFLAALAGMRADDPARVAPDVTQAYI